MKMPAERRYCFVMPRFGAGIYGGEATLVGALSARLAARGTAVQVFATCARDNRSWENHFVPGPAVEFGVPVQRFPVAPRDLDSWVPKQIKISEGMNLSLADQLDWMAQSVNSWELYAALARSQDDYDAFIFAPYLFGTTFWGSLINPAKSYLLPCLHDEEQAYTDVVQSMFRQAAGAIFNSAAEAELAAKLYGPVPGGEVGMGFDLPSAATLAALKPFFAEQSPYLLYVGRKETGKNAQLLIDYFIDYKDSGAAPLNLKLVIAGSGSFSDLLRPAALARPDIVDVEQFSDEDKQRLLKYAWLLCQPSLNESFSIVLMESWLLGTPVLVHADCAVTRAHVQEAGGGLYFADAADFAAVLNELQRHSDLRPALGAAGRRYVAEKYNWPAVLDRFDRVMAELVPL